MSLNGDGAEYGRVIQNEATPRKNAHDFPQPCPSNVGMKIIADARAQRANMGSCGRVGSDERSHEDEPPRGA